MLNKSLLMTRFEPGYSGIGSDRAVSCVTTTADVIFIFTRVTFFEKDNN